MQTIRLWLIVLAAGTAAILPLAAQAGSFQLNEQSTKSMSRANAGAASANTDASAVFYNPALLTQLQSMQFIVGATDFDIRGEFSKQSATDLAGQPLSGGNGGNMGDHNSIGAGVTPSISFAAPLGHRTVFGIALEVPFGLTTTYDGESVLRYQAQYTSIAVFNINPSVAYKVSDDFSVGFGLDIARAEGKLTNQIDYGAVCYGQIGPITCNALGLYPQSHDGFFQAEGSDTTWGWNAGLAWHRGGTTIGLAYRSRLLFTLSGSAEFKNVPAVFASSGAFKNTGINANLNLPDVLDLSATQVLSPAWTLSASVRYTRWSTLQDFIVRFDNPAQPPSSLTFDYRNVWFVALGADYHLNPSWTLHGGIAYDESPVQTAHREPRLPDDNRRWVALGATWNINPASSLSLGWAHLFIGDHTPMNHTGPMGDTVIGQWSQNADLYSLQYQYNF